MVLTGTPAEIVCDLASLTGRSCLPPAWALGFHQSRWSYRSQRAVLDVARRFRALDLPADVVHLDIDYMDRYRVFTWHPRRFPRPEQLHEELRTLGFRSLAIVDPGVSAVPYPAFDTLRAGDMLLTRADGEPYRGKVWPGATVFPDFTLPCVREAWGRMHRPLLAAGVGGFWIDMNDPVFRPARSTIHCSRTCSTTACRTAGCATCTPTAGAGDRVGPGRRATGPASVRAVALRVPRHPASCGGVDRRQSFQLAAPARKPAHGPEPGSERRAGHRCRHRWLWTGARQVGLLKPCRPSAELFGAGWNSAR